VARLLVPTYAVLSRVSAITAFVVLIFCDGQAETIAVEGGRFGHEVVILFGFLEGLAWVYARELPFGGILVFVF
jgi:hypothetical protein